MAGALHVASPLAEVHARSCWQKRVVLRLLGVAAVLLAFMYSADDNDAFVNGLATGRPSGRFFISEEQPQGMTCRAAYNYGDPERPVWNPMPLWRGEHTYHFNGPYEERYDMEAMDKYRQWYHFDADGKILGRLAVKIANHLRGKDSILAGGPRDVGNFVIVTNCEKVRVSGQKYHYKLYFRNLSRRPGHMKIERFCSLQERFPERIIMKAVWGMMPKTDYNKYVFRHRLKLFTGPNHLYYHEDPVDYDMRLVKDCTPDQFYKKNVRPSHIFYKVMPKRLEKAKRRKEIEDRDNLRAFKRFVGRQANRMDEEELANIDMDSLVQAAEEYRMENLAPKFEGKAPNKIPKAYYPGTQYVKKPLGGNRIRRHNR